ncbi:MAG: hypothetical protein NC911_09865, partial [Candidatus Omnitrophica bacterium]|nr:hypothetical protein [Candidatus Omnitrophota bacterium]
WGKKKGFMAKIAFIGDRLSLDFFRLLKIDVFPAETRAEASSLLKELQEKQYTTIFITEEVFEQTMKGAFLKGNLVVLPSWKKHQKESQKLVNELVRRATGMK